MDRPQVVPTTTLCSQERVVAEADQDVVPGDGGGLVGGDLLRRTPMGVDIQGRLLAVADAVHLDYREAADDIRHGPGVDVGRNHFRGQRAGGDRPGPGLVVAVAVGPDY